MKILHCADIHLDSPLSGLPHNKALQRRGEILNSFCDTVREAAKQGFSYFIVAGDLFESSHATGSAKSTLISAFEQCPQMTIIILTGNHDESAFDEGFKLRLPKNVKLFEDEICRIDDSEGVTFVGVDLSKVTADDLEGIEWKRENYNVLIAHGDVGTKSRYGAINLDSFWDKDVDYFALGHIHEYRKEQAGRGYACYCGCLEPRGFDETGQKGFVAINTEVLDRRQSVWFIPAAKRRAHVVNLAVGDAKSNADVINLMRQFSGNDAIPSEDMVEFVLEGETDEEVNLNAGIIAEGIKDLFFCVKVKDNTRVKPDYDKIAGTTSLKSQFVTLARQRISDPKLLNKVLKYGFNALNGEEIDLA